MADPDRSISFWVVVAFLAVFLVLLLAGQTMAIVDYELAVSLGLQEDESEVGAFGVAMNKAFGAGDTVVYVPLIVASLAGLFLRKRWAVVTTAAVMGISAYWASTVAFLFWFLPGTPGYTLEPGLEYAVFMGAFILFGVCGLVYLVIRGDRLVR
ncbi:MAG: hypothetical protein HKM95_05605 [Inquilinus sp.]|nr:hypothetical protein [Inquilinus sp.]